MTLIPLRAYCSGMTKSSVLPVKAKAQCQSDFIYGQWMNGGRVIQGEGKHVVIVMEQGVVE